ncbi:hypothetical protein ACHAWO_006366 [Cyclotella atomus]|uniref:Prolyl 4-hydroxylase alpha subunit Fe(2+) 2OG dioxygenase domain-containing protein n=1 Tax=Cyclotella atomus TaxID=382360 RepID=A0ABD3P7X8_9STRA
MDTVRAFQLDVDSIQSYLAKCDAPFATSQLYSTETEETYVDTDRRKSVYRTIVDPALFNLVEDLMKTINEGDDEYHYVLWKNGSDITHIKYEEGGCFKAHRDFNSTTSNMIEEFSLIVCVTPEEEAKGVEGGETSIVTFGGVGAKPVEKVYDTKTPGCALLFRKDLNHEGKPLIKGVKHIITANIFAVKKDQSEQVLYVTFPQEGVTSEGKVRTRSKTRALDSKKIKAAADAAIMHVANDSKSYALPVSILTGMLESHVRFSNSRAESEGKEPPQVVPFVCNDFTFEQFGVVARILNRCYVDEASITKGKPCLDYFGPFNVENLLIDLALEPSSDQPPVKRPKQEVESDEDVAGGFDSDIIVCENESRMKAVLSTARAFNQPYVPFKILFIEGMLHSFDGDGMAEIIPFDIPMTAAAAFVGDHNNVFGIWSLDQYFVDEDNVFTLKKAHEYSPFFECAPQDHSDRLLKLPLGSKVELFDPPPGANYSSWEMPFKVTRTTHDGEAKVQTVETSEDFLRGGMGLGLNVRASDPELKSGLLKYMFNKYDRSDVKPLDLRAGLTKESSVVHPVNNLFHLDGKGKACFTREQAKLASDYIASINLEQRVKASLNKKQFELPQVSEKVSMVYCNDDRYGKMNVLWVCGVLRLELDDAKSSTSVSQDSSEQEKFEAWPSQEAKEKIRHSFNLADKYDNIVRHEGVLPDKWWEYDSDESSTLLYSSDEEDE